MPDLRILHVEDSPNDAELIQAGLEADGLSFEAVRVETGDEMIAALKEGRFDLVLCDYTLPSFDGLSALLVAKERCPDVPFIFVSGTIGEERAVECLKRGATDYLLKDRLSRLAPAVRRALREAEEQAARRKAEERIRHLAYFDPLTGLANRVFLQDRLQEMLGQGRGPAALLFMDLSNFTAVNDTLGHLNGDRLLQDAARRLQGALPDAVQIARLGGDDFAVLLRSGADGAAHAARKILDAFQQPFAVENLSLEIGASIGAALAPEHAQDASGLLRKAEVAMAQAKRADDGYALYAPERDPNTRVRLALLGELRRAIEHGQLVLHYQPKVNLRTGKATGVEALVRWAHPERGLVEPGDFVPLAEQCGLMKPLTYWVVGEALRQGQAWRREGLDLTVSANMSARNLLDPSMAEQVSGLLASTGTLPDRLCLEITESAIMGDLTRTLAHLARFNAMGIKLSVDDFGTGYSSLAYLKQLPVHEVKIDKTFVLGLMRDRNDAAIVRAALDVAHTLGLTVTAEGVEDQQTWHGLIAFGCDTAQGYFMSPPLPPDDLAAWVRKGAP